MAEKTKAPINTPQDSKKGTGPKRPGVPGMPAMKPTQRSWFFYVLVALLAFGFFYSLSADANTADERSFSEVVGLINEGQVKEITVVGDRLDVVLNDETEVVSRRDSFEGLTETFANLGVDVTQIQVNYDDPAKEARLFQLFINFGPIILILFIIMFMFSRARGGAGGDVFSFGKSKARLFSKDTPQTKFTDVGGADEAKHELEEVVDFLKNPEKYRKLGARIPKGVLLVGPAGTGKTLLARAIAGEAEVPFFSIAGSEFMEMLVGVGASRVRDLFQTAKSSAPALIFIDEVESIGRQRGYGVGGGHDEREQTLNQILVEMDGFESNANVIVLAATNRPDLLDPALVRAGRFDRRVVVGLPDIDGRKKIIEIHMKGKPLADDVKVDALARRTVGYSGADLESMLNEAAIMAAGEGEKKINRRHLEEAATKVKLGPEKKRMQSEEARTMTAYHEAGHAIVMHELPTTDPVHLISIISRGMALGFTLAPPTSDRYNETKERLEDMIASFMGGRAAEELVYGKFTTGASDDLDKATQVARDMVTEYGMSALGPISFRSYGDEPSFYRAGTDMKISPQLLEKIDAEVQRILDEAYDKALSILKAHRAQLDEVTEQLVKDETMRAEEFEAIMGGAKEGKEASSGKGVVIGPEA